MEGPVGKGISVEGSKDLVLILSRLVKTLEEIRDEDALPDEWFQRAVLAVTLGSLRDVTGELIERLKR